MTIEQRAREIARQTFDITDYSFPHGEEAARLGIIEGLEMGAVQLDGWREWDWPEGVSRHAVAHVAEHFATAIRALIEEQKV